MNSARRPFLTAAAVFAMSLGSMADQTPKPSAPAVPGVERIVVRLAQFDVVVRDRSGKIASGLGPADFKVLEDGSPLEIVAVDEWGLPETPATSPSGPARPPEEPASVAPPSAVPAEASKPAAAAATANTGDSPAAERRSFVIVFDGLGESTALRMSQAKKAATDFVRTRFRTGDVGAVYQLDLSLRSMSGITSNREDLVHGIERVAWMPATSLADQINESVLAYTFKSNSPYQKDRLANQSANVAEQLDWQRDHTYDLLNDLSNIFQAMPGKRLLVLASPGFPMTTSADQRMQRGGFTPKFQKLIKSLATYGVTVYSLDIGSDLSMGDAGEAIDWRIAVGKLGMDENVLSDLGLERALGTNSASSRREFLGVIAAETGGRLLTNTDLGRSFNAIDEESTRFYRVSCRVAVTTDTNRYRRFKVVIDRDGYTVTSRRGRYSDVTPFDRTATTATATGTVESVDRYKPLTVQGTAAPLPVGTTAKIPVAVLMQVIGPVDIPANSRGAGDLDLEVLIVARAADEVVARYERSITATVRAEGLDRVRRAFRVEGRLDLVPGIYEVQGTVRLASPAQLGTWSGRVAVPPQSSGKAMTIIGPLLNADGDAGAPLLSSPPVDESADPVAVKPGMRFLPSTTTDLAVADPLLAMFWLKGIASTGDKPPELDVSVTVLNPDGGSAGAPTQIAYFGPDPAGGFRVIARAECSGLSPGAYVLRVGAGPRDGSAPPTYRNAPFTLHARDNTPVPAPPPSPPPVTSSSKP